MTDPDARNPHTDLDPLARLVMELPPAVGLKISFWNGNGAPSGTPVVGMAWEVYVVQNSHLFPQVDDIWGFTEEGPVRGAEYIREQLTNLGVLSAEEP